MEKNRESKREEAYSDEEIMKRIAEVTLANPAVSSMSTTFANALAKPLKSISFIKNAPVIPVPQSVATPSVVRGVRLMRENGILIDIYLTVHYETNIPQLAFDLQSAIKRELLRMTDEKIRDIDVHIQGVEKPFLHNEEETKEQE